MSEVNTQAVEGGEKKTELTPEQTEAIAKNGRQSETATRPDKPSKEALDEEHGVPDNTKKEPDKKDSEPAKEEEPKKEDAQEDNSWKQQYVQMDNPHAQAAIDMLKEAKVSPVEANDIFAKAIETGDITKVDWETLEKKVGKNQAFLIKSGVEQYYAGEFKRQQDTVQTGYEMFGGEEGWNKARDYFQKLEKSDKDFASKMKSYRSMLNEGGHAGKMALDALLTTYNSDSKNTTITTKKLETGTSAPAKSANGALSKEDYQKELSKIDSMDTNAYQELRKRRALGMQQGI